jgi:DNA (cytosine-5)-methyltransferase 1
MVYYNEFDKQKAAWLRELIAQGAVARGEVDERDIKDIRPSELKGYRQCHFFAGIGVWSYALRLAGWPDEREVWTGSCPCGPFSEAGKRAGFADERHLWPYWFHLIEHGRSSGIPVFGEQVASKGGLAWLDLVQSDLEGTQNAFWAMDLCAAGFGTPHIRQRLYWVASRARAMGDTTTQRLSLWPSEEIPGSGSCSLSERSSDACSLGIAPSEGQQGREDFSRDCGKELQALERAGSITHPSDSVGSLVDADGRNTSTERQQRGRQQRFLAPDCSVDPSDSVGSLEHSEGIGRRRRPDNEDGRWGELSPSDSGPAEPGPVNGFWAGATWIRCTDGKYRAVESIDARTIESWPVAMADGVAADLGLVRIEGSGAQGREAWEGFVWPLIHKGKARTSRLRGYGDAIVAQQAAEFIRAVVEEGLV